MIEVVAQKPNESKPRSGFTRIGVLYAPPRTTYLRRNIDFVIDLPSAVSV